MLSRIPYFLLILICVIAVLSVPVAGDSQRKSTVAVKDLLAAVQRNDVNAARQMLGDNTCNCPPRGGWTALLKYEWAHEPNLAFLLGHKFAVSDLSNEVVQLRHRYIFPWDKPEDRKVDLNIRFLDAPPYFLPLKLAFGMPMKEGEFKQWRADFTAAAAGSTDTASGAKDMLARAFSLRLRNSLVPGAIVQLPPDKREAMLPADLRPYIHPRDCAAVIDEQGKPWSIDTLALQLPRLKSVHASFAVVRRGVLSPWTIKSVKFSSPQWELL